MTDKKVIKGSDIVIVAEKEGVSIAIDAQTFRMHDFEGCSVTGDPYYVKKAMDAGAKKGK